METKSFIKLLRKVIREEVQSVVRKEVRMLLKERVSNHKQVIKHGMDLHKVVEAPRGPVAKKKKFTKNSMLNDLLNETATTAPSQEVTDWSTMNFKSEMAEAYTTPDMSKNISQPLASVDVNGAPVNMENDKVAATMGAMTKDYSALMKAIDKKKGIN